MDSSWLEISPGRGHRRLARSVSRRPRTSRARLAGESVRSRPRGRPRTYATGVMSASSRRGATALTRPRPHYSARQAGGAGWPMLFRQAAELVSAYLEPLARRRSWRPSSKQTPASRRSRAHGMDKVVSRGREARPFVWWSYQSGSAFDAIWRAR